MEMKRNEQPGAAKSSQEQPRSAPHQKRQDPSLIACLCNPSAVHVSETPMLIASCASCGGAAWWCQSEVVVQPGAARTRWLCSLVVLG